MSLGIGFGSAGAAAGGFSPASLSPALWLSAGAGNATDAAGTTPALDADLVKAVADRTAHGINASQSTTGNEALRRFDGDWCWVCDLASWLPCAYDAATDFGRTSPFSVEFKIRPNFGAEPASVPNVIGKLGAGGSYPGYSVRATKVGGNYRVQFLLMSNNGGGDFLDVTGSTNLVNGTYYHVAVTYSGSGAASGVAIYVDGIAETTTANHDALVGPTTSAVGVSVLRSNDGFLRCPCRLRFLRIYPSALTSGQVAQLVAYSATAHDPAPPALPAAGTPVPLILDTDLGEDQGDLHAAEMLHRLADAGYVSILATVSDTTTDASPGALAGINGYFSRSSVPVGAWKGSNFSSSDAYATVVRDHFSLGTVRADYPDGSAVYRQALAAAAANSVAIVAIGMLDNLKALLQSSADGFSALTGVQLVAAKVRSLHVMGGDYPAGTEYNFAKSPAAAAYVFANWPTTVPIRSHGYTAGLTPVVGGLIRRWVPTSVPVAVFDTPPPGVSSWDAQTLLEATLTSSSYFAAGGGDGTNTVNASTGANAWAATPHAGHDYLVKSASDATLRQIIDGLLLAGMTQ